MTRTYTRGENELMQLAAFRVGPHECALDIMGVKEIVNAVPITPIPKAPEFLEGVIELRGAIVPMVDMRQRFGLPAVEMTEAAKYIIVTFEGRILGLVVDEVTEVVRIPRSEVRKTPPDLVSGPVEPFSGMFRHQGRLVVVLDLKVLLTSKEKFTLAEMAKEKSS